MTIEPCPCGADALQMESDFLSDSCEVKCGECERTGGEGETESRAWALWNKAVRAAREV